MNDSAAADYNYNVDAAKWLGIRASKDPFDGLQNLLDAGFLNRGDIPILRRFIRRIMSNTPSPEELVSGYELAIIVKQKLIAELERIISLIEEQPIREWSKYR